MIFDHTPPDAKAHGEPRCALRLIMDSAANFADAGAVIDLLDRAGRALRDSPLLRGCAIRLPRRGRLLATGDLHDNPFHLDRILRLARLDESPDHHVDLHELIHGENLINGMDFSHRMILRAADLIVRFPHQVHPLLANHELSQMTGRGVSKGAGDSVRLFSDAVEFVFGERAGEVSSSINQFLRSWPLAIITDSGILCAHSLPAEYAIDRFDVGVFDRVLTEADYQPRTGSAYLLVWGRGLSGAYLDRLAGVLNVKAFCLGHEHAETGWRSLGTRGIILNSDHERAAVLPIDLTADPRPEEWARVVQPLSGVGGAEFPMGTG